MRRALLFLVTLISLPLTAAPLARVAGQVTLEGDVLPGCVVQLKSATMIRTAVTDSEGRYAFQGVPEGTYELRFEFAGAEPAQRWMPVYGESIDVPVQDLEPVPVVEVITVVTCGADRPADTFGETWNELVSHAEIAVRFPHKDDELSPEYFQWCAERGIAPEERWSMSFRALETAAADPRSHPLLLRALATNDSSLIEAAITGLGKQQDFASLPLIESAIARTRNPGIPAIYLAHFADERADIVARKYEGQFYSNVYEEWRSRAKQAADNPH